VEEHPEVTAVTVRAWDRPAVTVPVFAVLALVGGQLPSFTAAANLYILGTGGLLILLGQRTPRQRRPMLGMRATWWLVPAGLFAALEMVTLALGHRTLSLLADPPLEREAVRSAGYFAWLAALWWMVRR
jgi:hypothetical protein